MLILIAAILSGITLFIAGAIANMAWGLGIHPLAATAVFARLSTLAPH